MNGEVRCPGRASDGPGTADRVDRPQSPTGSAPAAIPCASGSTSARTTTGSSSRRWSSGAACASRAHPRSSTPWTICSSSESPMWSSTSHRRRRVLGIPAPPASCSAPTSESSGGVPVSHSKRSIRQPQQRHALVVDGEAADLEFAASRAHGPAPLSAFLEKNIASVWGNGERPSERSPEPRHGARPHQKTIIAAAPTGPIRSRHPGRSRR